MTKFHSEQKVTVTMEFDKSILTVSFFLMTLKWIVSLSPHTHFSKSGRINSNKFFYSQLHNS